MTRKDYIKIAAIFNNHAQPREAYPIESARLKELVDNMVDMLAQDNPQFDTARFIKATGF